MATKRKHGARWEYTLKHKALLLKSVTLKFTTEAEGDAVCARLEKQLDAGVVPAELDIRSQAATITLKQAIRSYLQGNTVCRLRSTAARHLGRPDRQDRLDLIDYPWTEAWISSLKLERVLSPWTIRHYTGALAKMG